MEEYFDKGDVEVATLKRCIKAGTISGAFRPVLCGTAFKNKGVQPLLERGDRATTCRARSTCPGSALPRARARKMANTPTAAVSRRDPDAAFAGLAFKIVNDKRMAR